MLNKDKVKQQEGAPSVLFGEGAFCDEAIKEKPIVNRKPANREQRRRLQKKRK